MSSPLLDDFLDAAFFAVATLAHELDRDAVFFCQPLSILSDLLSQWLSKPRIIENTNIVSVQVRSHSCGIAEAGQRSLDHHTIPAGKHPVNLILISLEYRCHTSSMIR